MNDFDDRIMHANYIYSLTPPAFARRVYHESIIDLLRQIAREGLLMLQANAVNVHNEILGQGEK